MLALAGALGALSLAAFAGLGRPLSERVALLISAGATASALAAAALAAAALLPHPPLARLGLVARGPARGPSAILALGFVALSHACQALVQWLGLGGTGTLDALERAVAGMPAPELAAGLLSLALAPGIAEELFFRGLLQRGLEARIGAGGAVVAAAALFSLAHFDRAQSLAAFPMGLYLGVVVAVSGSLRPAIVCHVLNNALALLEAWAAAGLPGPPLVWLVGGSAAAAVALGVGLPPAARRSYSSGRCRPTQHEEGRQREEPR